MGPDGCIYAVGGFGVADSESDIESSVCLNSAEKYDFER
jgi:hypothetical protein